MTLNMLSNLSVVFISIYLIKSVHNEGCDSNYGEEFDSSGSNEVLNATSEQRKFEALSSNETNYSQENQTDSSDGNLDPYTKDMLSKMELENFPFAVSILKKGAHYSNGALIAKRWIITSAYEFYNVRESIKLYKARLGSVDCKNGGIVVPLKGVEIHPSYVYEKPSFDISLLKTAKQMAYDDNIRPSVISKFEENVLSAKFFVVYWPRLIIKGQLLPSIAKERLKHSSMRVSTQELIPWKVCAQRLRMNGDVLDPSTLCLKPIKSHHSVCRPDPGAPVVTHDALWAITSGWTSKDCRTHPGPTLVTRLTSKPVRSWIDEKILFE